MSKRRHIERGCGCLAIITATLVVTAPVTLMGPAVFLDSKRSVLSSATSPDGRRIAQLERLVVGGVPSIVVTVRRSWEPDWYLTSCKAVSHYHEAPAKLHWLDDVTVRVESPSSDWGGHPPFRWAGPLHARAGCSPVTVLTPAAPAS